MVSFFFNDTATTEIYTLSLHDALPISGEGRLNRAFRSDATGFRPGTAFSVGRRGVPTRHEDRIDEPGRGVAVVRSEEHTSELQSRQYLVCRLLLEKKKNKSVNRYMHTV